MQVRRSRISDAGLGPSVVRPHIRCVPVAGCRRTMTNRTHPGHCCRCMAFVVQAPDCATAFDTPTARRPAPQPLHQPRGFARRWVSEGFAALSGARLKSVGELYNSAAVAQPVARGTVGKQRNRRLGMLLAENPASRSSSVPARKPDVSKAWSPVRTPFTHRPPETGDRAAAVPSRPRRRFTVALARFGTASVPVFGGSIS